MIRSSLSSSVVAAAPVVALVALVALTACKDESTPGAAKPTPTVVPTAAATPSSSATPTVEPPPIAKPAQPTPPTTAAPPAATPGATPRCAVQDCTTKKIVDDGCVDDGKGGKLCAACVNPCPKP